jgi:hypothetical protein
MYSIVMSLLLPVSVIAVLAALVGLVLTLFRIWFPTNITSPFTFIVVRWVKGTVVCAMEAKDDNSIASMTTIFSFFDVKLRIGFLFLVDFWYSLFSKFHS